jgi:hypothetical protein
MDIRIDKYSDVVIVADPRSYTHAICRRNSEMTKELIEAEMRVRFERTREILREGFIARERLFWGID